MMTRHELVEVEGSRDVIRVDLSIPFRELKRYAISVFEKSYLRALLRQHKGNLASAARAAGIDRKNLWIIVARYQIDRTDFVEKPQSSRARRK
jgi:DNA-binding NtrC family response regulator